MITVKEAVKRSKIFKENGLAEIFERAEKAEEQKKLNEVVKKVVDEKENEHEKEEIIRLKKEKADFIASFPKFKTFTTRKGITVTRKLYSFEADYPKPALQEIIFSHGKSNYTIWFLNRKKKICVIDNAMYDGNNLYLTVTIDAKGNKKRTYMTLDRFLSLVEQGDFVITFKKFVDTYLKDITESNYYKSKIAEFDKKIAEINAK